MVYGILNSFNSYSLFQVQKLSWTSKYQYNVRAQMCLIIKNPSM